MILVAPSLFLSRINVFLFASADCGAIVLLFIAQTATITVRVDRISIGTMVGIATK